MAEGCVGLMIAVQRFDPDRGVRFLTYARHWVRARLLALLTRAHVVRRQRHGIARMRRELARLELELGPADDVIEDRLVGMFGVGLDAVRSKLAGARPPEIALESESIEAVPDRGAGPELQVASRERTRLVRRVVDAARSGLDDRERMILDERLLAEDAEDLAALARRVGLSRERLRQIEARLKRRLRRALEAADTGAEPASWLS